MVITKVLPNSALPCHSLVHDKVQSGVVVLKVITRVCVSLYRNNDRACLQRLVFNMRDSDVVKFDDVIQHNSTMDSRTRQALYRNIRRQIACYFEDANKKQTSPVCRYCKVAAGALNEYVAFVVFSETAEFGVDASAGEDEIVVTRSVNAGRNVDPRNGGSEGLKAVSRTTGDNHTERESDNQEVVEVKQNESVQRKKDVPRGSQVQEQKTRNVMTARQDVTQTSGVGEQLAEKQAVDNVEVSKHRDSTQTVVLGETVLQEMNVMKTVDNHVDDVEPVGVISRSDVPTPEDREPPRIMNNHELCADVVVAGATSSQPHDHDVIIEVDNQSTDSPELNGSGELYAWKTDVRLKSTSDAASDDVGLRNTEYEILSDWLSSRVDSTTAIHRFPVLYDLPVLAPRENPERSVTWRLAEKFAPSKPATEPVAPANEQVFKHKKAASDVIFIGPYDRDVIIHSEVVRRRVSYVCDDMLPLSASDIICVTDVGHDVSLTRISDIVNMSKLSATKAKFGAYTGADTKSSCASCVLLIFTPPAPL